VISAENTILLSSTLIASTNIIYNRVTAVAHVTPNW